MFSERHTTALSSGIGPGLRRTRRWRGPISRKNRPAAECTQGPVVVFCLPFALRTIRVLARTRRRRRSRIPVHMSAYLGPMQTAGIHRPARTYRRTVVQRARDLMADTEAAL